MGMLSQFSKSPGDLPHAVISEICSYTTGCRVRELKCPDSQVKHYKSASCYIRQWIAEHAIVLVLVCAVVLDHKHRSPFKYITYYYQNIEA